MAMNMMVDGDRIKDGIYRIGCGRERGVAGFADGCANSSQCGPAGGRSQTQNSTSYHIVS